MIARAYVPEYKVVADVLEWNSAYCHIRFIKDGLEWEIDIPSDEIFIEEIEENE